MSIKVYQSIRKIGKFLILFFIIIMQIENIKSWGDDPCECYMVTLEDATLFLYSTMNMPLLKDNVSIDNPPLEYEFKYSKQSIENNSLIVGLFSFMKIKISEIKFIKSIELENNNIKMKINISDPKISEMIIIYNGFFFITEIKTSKANFDLSEKGEEKFHKEFFLNETSTVMKLVREYIARVKNYNEQNISLNMYEYNQAISNHIKIEKIIYHYNENIRKSTKMDQIELEKEVDVVYDDKNYIFSKEDSLISFLEDYSISYRYDLDYFSINFNINYFDFYIFPERNESIKYNLNILYLVEFREIGRVINEIEKIFDEMEKYNREIFTNIDKYQDSYKEYANMRKEIIRINRFLEVSKNNFEKYDEINCISSSDRIDLEIKIEDMQLRLKTIEIDFDLTERYGERANQIISNKYMFYLTLFILLVSLITTILNFISIRKSNIPLDRLEESEKSQENLLRNIESELKKINMANKQNMRKIIYGKKKLLKKNIKRANKKN